MMLVSESVWAQLVFAWEDAERRYDEARAAYDRIPLSDNDAGLKCPEEEAYDAASEAESHEEDKLLGVEAPHMAGATLQLRLFARRYHSVDLASAPSAPEEPDAAVLRRIYSALTRHQQ